MNDEEAVVIASANESLDGAIISMLYTSRSLFIDWAHAIDRVCAPGQLLCRSYVEQNMVVLDAFFHALSADLFTQCT